MLDSGNFNKSAGIPLNSKQNIDPADDPKIQEAITQKTKVGNNYKDVMDAYEAIAAMPNAGEAPLSRGNKALSKIPWIGEIIAAGASAGEQQLQRPRDQILDALSQRLSANGASAETMEMMKRALSPTMFDSPETLKKGSELVHQHFNHSPDFHPGVLKKYGLDKELPEIKFDVSKAMKSRGETPDNSPAEKKESSLDHLKKALHIKSWGEK